MKGKIKAVVPFVGRRLRVRYCDAEWFANYVSERAIKRGDWVIDVMDGGGVCNSYGWPAETECVLAISNPQGYTAYWTGRAPANKITSTGAAAACLPHKFEAIADLFDGRVRRPERIEAARKLARELHLRSFGMLGSIAAALGDVDDDDDDD